jgi:hypothetical protein
MPQSPHLDYTIDMLHPLLEFLSAKYMALNPARKAARAKHDEIFADENKKDGHRFADIVFLKHFFRKERKFTKFTSHHPKYRAICDFFARIQYKNHSAMALGFNGNVDALMQWAANELFTDIEQVRTKIMQCMNYHNELIRKAYDTFGPIPRNNLLTLEQKLEQTMTETIDTGRGHIFKELKIIESENTKAANILSVTDAASLRVEQSNLERSAFNRKTPNLKRKRGVRGV